MRTRFLELILDPPFHSKTGQAHHSHPLNLHINCHSRIILLNARDAPDFCKDAIQ